LSYELKVALRFLKGGKTQTIFIIVGIAIGVAVQIFLGALIGSLQDSLVEETIGNSAHITILNEEDGLTRLLAEEGEGASLLRGNYYPYQKTLNNWQEIFQKIQGEEQVKAVSPVLSGNALVRSTGKDRSVQIKGIQMKQADPIYGISSRMVEGTAQVEANSLLIGKSLADDMGLGSGDSIDLLTPSGQPVRFFVGGIFDLENESLNSSLLFMELGRAQTLFQSGSGISAIEVQIKDPFIADTVAAKWRVLLGGVEIREWKEQNAQLLSALTSQSNSSYTIQFFVILAVTFGISSVLAVSVIQKSREIGILKAMGTSKKSASRIFVLQGLILGSIGALVGVLLGVLLLGGFNLSQSLSFSIVYKAKEVLLIAMIAVGAGTLASVIPARRSAALNPMEAIKNG